jgi:hypothetical protein
MKNLILTSAVGYDFSKIEVFIKSLRKYYHDDVVILINLNQNETKSLLNKYNVKFIEKNINPKNTYQYRFDCFYSYLEDKFENYTSIFLTDSRDVFFQGNPFLYKYNSNINFYLEDNIIENCKHNSNWIKKTTGLKSYNSLKKNRISCSGTVIGKSKEIFFYLKLMKENIKIYKYKKSLKEYLFFKKKHNGYDQGIHNFIVYNEFFTNFHLWGNTDGNMATVNFNYPLLNFNANNFLINDKRRPYDVVHQYDRVTVVHKFQKTIQDILT